MEVGWKSAPADVQRRVFPEAYLRWGRCREKLKRTTADALASDEVVADVVEAVNRKRLYRDVPLARLDVYVGQAELNFPWEYRSWPGTHDDDPDLHPWPTVVRTQRKDWERRSLNSPPAHLGVTGVACMLGKCAAFLQDTKARGAFFAAWCDCDAVDEGTLSKAAAHAGIGIWLRTATPLASARRILDEIDGLPVSELPNHVHTKRGCAPKGSEWRDVSILYDPPDLPSFEFSDEGWDAQNELRTLTALA